VSDGQPETHPSLELDEVVHQRVRLGILAVLSETSECTFAALRDQLGLTDANLGGHIRSTIDSVQKPLSNGRDEGMHLVRALRTSP